MVDWEQRLGLQANLACCHTNRTEPHLQEKNAVSVVRANNAPAGEAVTEALRTSSVNDAAGGRSRMVQAVSENSHTSGPLAIHVKHVRAQDERTLVEHSSVWPSPRDLRATRKRNQDGCASGMGRPTC